MRGPGGSYGTPRLGFVLKIMENQGGEQEGQMHVSHESLWVTGNKSLSSPVVVGGWERQVGATWEGEIDRLVKGEGWGTQAQLPGLWLGQLRWGPQQMSDDEGLYLQGAQGPCRWRCPECSLGSMFASDVGWEEWHCRV